MASGMLTEVVRHLRRIADRERGADRSDRDLLAQFVARHDEAAFTALVHRHGPMVFGVCRHLLRDRHAAEDAFQATFLVLVQRAGAIRDPRALGNWLYGVAYRVAARARGRAARRQVYEQRGADMAAEVTPNTIDLHELRPVLHDELNRLPEMLRAPVVLCYLEGQSRETAARQLRTTTGAIRSRLARARDRLRGRLTRRGWVLPAGFVTAVLAPGSLCAAVPPALAADTVRAAVQVAAGQAAAAVVSTQAAAFTEGALQTMTMTKIKLAGLVMLLGCLLGLGTTWLVAEGASPVASAGRLKRQTKTEPKPAAPADDRTTLQGGWKIVSVIKNGVPVPEGELKFAAMYFVDDFIFVNEGGSYKPAKYKIDPAQKPKTIDVMPNPDDDPERVHRGIYHVEGNDLELCFGEQPDLGERPKLFASKPGSKLVHFALKRDPKAEKPDVEKVKKDFAPVAVKETSINNLKQIAIAMHNYHNDHGHFPPAANCDKNGKPLLSWRVALLPYLEQANLYQQFKLDEPWDSENNKKCSETLVKVYLPVTGKDRKKPVTHYRVFTGKGSAFDGCEVVKLTDITDGSSNTVLVVEAGEAVPWAKPDDLPYDPEKPLPKLGGLFPDVFHIVLADASVRPVKIKFNEKVFRDMITRDGGEAVDIDELDK